MGDDKPTFTITNEIVTYVSSISEKIGRITFPQTHCTPYEKCGTITSQESNQTTGTGGNHG